MKADVHGTGKDGIEAKSSWLSRENHKVTMETPVDK